MTRYMQWGMDFIYISFISIFPQRFRKDGRFGQASVGAGGSAFCCLADDGAQDTAGCPEAEE